MGVCVSLWQRVAVCDSLWQSVAACGIPLAKKMHKIVPNELSDVQMIYCAKMFWKPLTTAATVTRCLRPTVELDGMVLDLLWSDWHI